MKLSHNVISKFQKLFIFILLLSLFQCAENEPPKDQKFWIRFFTHPLGYIWLLSHRELRESPRCGGDQIGTLLGYNNNLPTRPKLGENEEIVTPYFKSTAYEYYPTKNSKVTIILLEKVKITDDDSITCRSDNNKIYITYCNGKILDSLDGYPKSNILLGVEYSETFSANTKYFIWIGSTSDEETVCNLKAILRSSTL
ncbi:MAG: hypothetical protein N3A69_09605 [Leptospiraceae bacterium]|nr:hypothetical protein [Leptospiraceae bacterium]